MTTPDSLLSERYQLCQRLGGGDMACTYLAKRLIDNESVIVKELQMGHLADWKVFDLFKREAQILSQLDHPHIPKVLDYFEDTQNNCFYLITTKVSGQSLEQKCQAGWVLPESDAKKLARQILAILVYLQGLNPPIIHRDIKPSNLMLDEQGQVHLIDFGAVQATLQPEGGSTIVGTFGYMAPEQYLGQAVPASDLYSTGVTLIQILSGRNIADLVQDNLRLNFRPFVMISAPFAEWLGKMTAPNLAQRFQSAHNALNALIALDAEVALPFHVPLPSPTVLKIHRTNRYLRVEFGSHWLIKLIALACGLPMVSFVWSLMPVWEYATWGQMLRDSLYVALPLAIVIGTVLTLLFLRTHLEITKHTFRISHHLLGLLSWQTVGKTPDILKVALEDEPYIQNQQDIFRRFLISWLSPLKIHEGASKIHALGRRLFVWERNWLADEINDFLAGAP